MNFLLKIVDGPNKGAEIALVDGVAVSFGKQDDCDIVLADATLPDEPMKILATSEKVTLNGNDLEQFHVTTMGATSFAVGPADSPWSALVWPKAEPEEKPEAAPAGDGAAEEPSREEPEPRSSGIETLRSATAPHAVFRSPVSIPARLKASEASVETPFSNVRFAPAVAASPCEPSREEPPSPPPGVESTAAESAPRSVVWNSRLARSSARALSKSRSLSAWKSGELAAAMRTASCRPISSAFVPAGANAASAPSRPGRSRSSARQ